jgi:hypothetical protein
MVQGRSPTLDRTGCQLFLGVSDPESSAPMTIGVSQKIPRNMDEKNTREKIIPSIGTMMRGQDLSIGKKHKKLGCFLSCLPTNGAVPSS